MKSLFEDSVSRVWHDGTSPIVFVRFTQIPDKKNFLHLANITAAFVKQQLRVSKNAYAIIDLSDFVDGAPRIGEHLYRWLFQLHRYGIEFTAVVMPKKEQIPSEKLPSNEEAHVTWFSCFEKALRNINTQMTMNLL